MYILRQTTQSPLQFVFCSDGLNANGGTQLASSTGSTPVYISQTGNTPSVYTNQKGTLSYSMVKTGKTTGTSTGTATSTTAFNDSYTGGTGTTTYTLSISDSNTGQKYTYVNTVGWGIV